MISGQTMQHAPLLLDKPPELLITRTECLVLFEDLVNH